MLVATKVLWCNNKVNCWESLLMFHLKYCECLGILLCLALGLHGIGARTAWHTVDADITPFVFHFGIIANFWFLHVEAVAEGGGGELAGGDDGIALGHTVEHRLYVGFLDDVEVFVGGGVLGAHYPCGSVIHGNAFLPEECLNPWLVKPLFSFDDKVLLVAEEDDAHNAPHVILEVGVIERHAPAMRCRWECA